MILIIIIAISDFWIEDDSHDGFLPVAITFRLE